MANPREQILEYLADLPPVLQADIDMRLHDLAIRGRNDFSDMDKAALADDMEQKRGIARALTRSVSRPEADRLVRVLQRDMGIHQSYLKMPASDETGSHDWHKAWTDVYRGWVGIINRKTNFPKMPAPPNERNVRLPPPMPPPDQNLSSAFDGILGMGQAEAAPIPNLGDFAGMGQAQGPAEQLQTIFNEIAQVTSNTQPQTTDSYGNYWDGIQGKWISPEGNTYDPNDGFWHSADGKMVYVDGTWRSTNWRQEDLNATFESAGNIAAAEAAAAQTNFGDPQAMFEEEQTKIWSEIESQANQLVERDLQTFVINDLQSRGLDYDPDTQTWDGPGLTQDTLKAAQDEAVTKFIVQHIDPLEEQGRVQVEQLAASYQQLIDSRMTTTGTEPEALLGQGGEFYATDADRRLRTEGTLRGRALEEGTLQPANLAEVAYSGLSRITAELKPVQEAAGFVGRKVGSVVDTVLNQMPEFNIRTGLSLTPGTPAGGRGAELNIGHRDDDLFATVGEEVGEGLIPTTPEELAIAFVPGIGLVPGARSFARIAVKEGLGSAVKSIIAGAAVDQLDAGSRQLVEESLEVLSRRVGSSAPTPAEVQRALEIIHVVNGTTPVANVMSDIDLMIQLRRYGVIDDATLRESLQMAAAQAGPEFDSAFRLLNEPSLGAPGSDLISMNEDELGDVSRLDLTPESIEEIELPEGMESLVRASREEELADEIGGWMEDSMDLAGEALEQQPSVPMRSIIPDSMVADLPGDLRSILNKNSDQLTVDDWDRLMRFGMATVEDMNDLAPLENIMRQHFSINNGANQIYGKAANLPPGAVGGNGVGGPNVPITGPANNATNVMKTPEDFRLLNIDELKQHQKRGWLNRTVGAAAAIPGGVRRGVSASFRTRNPRRLLTLMSQAVKAGGKAMKTQNGLLVNAEWIRMIEAHGNTLQMFHSRIGLDLAAAGVRTMPGGQIDIGNGVRITVAELFNDTPATLPPTLQSVVGKWLGYFDEYDNLMRSMGATDADFQKHLRVYLPGQTLPHVNAAAGTRLALNFEAGKFVKLEKDPATMITRALEARMRWIEERWLDNMVTELETGKKLVDAQLANLNKQVEALHNKLASINQAKNPGLYDQTKKSVEFLEEKLAKLEPKAVREADVGSTLRVINRLNNEVRSLSATMDLSFMGIQGLLGVSHDPVAWSQSVVAALSSTLGRLSPIDKARWIDDNLETINIGLKHGLTLYGDVQHAEFFTSKLLKGPLNLPNLWFSEFGNQLRIKTLNLALNARRSAGRSLDDIKEMDELIDAINNMTGAGKGSGNVNQDFYERLVLFAPRFFRSQFGIAASAATKGGTVTGSLPFAHFLPASKFQAATAGDLARQTMLELVATGSLVTYIANEQLGNTDLDFLNPTVTGPDGIPYPNPNFMRIRWNGKDYSVFGQWDTAVQLINTGLNRGATDAIRNTLEFKASPLVRTLLNDMKPTLEALTQTDNFREISSSSPGDVISFIGKMAGGIAERVVPFAVRDIVTEPSQGPFLSKVLGGALEVGGVKSTPMTQKEKTLEILNDRVAIERQGLKALHPEFTDQELDRLALAKAKQRDDVKDAYRVYWEWAVRNLPPESSRWAERLIARDGITTQYFDYQKDTLDANITTAWEGRKDRFNENVARINELEGQLSQLLDSEEINQLEELIEKNSNAIDGLSDASKALAIQIAGLGKSRNAATRGGIQTDTKLKSQATERSVDDEVDGLEDSRGSLISAISGLSAAIKAASQQKNDLYAQYDPEIQAIIDELTVLRAEQKGWTDQVYDWIDATKDANASMGDELNGVDKNNKQIIEYYASLDPNTVESKMYAFRNEVYDKYKDEVGNIPSDAWVHINSQMDAYRSGLEPANRELWDILMAPKTMSDLEQQLAAAREAGNREAGTFMGADVRLSKPEQTLWGAALLTAGLPPDQPIGSPEEIEAVGLAKAQTAQGLIDEATNAIFAGDPGRAIQVLGTIVQTSGGDAGDLINEFETMTRATARRTGAAFETYNDALRQVTEGAIARLGTAPSLAALGESMYNDVKDAKDAGKTTTGTTPPWAPEVSSTYPKGTDPVQVSDPVLDHWIKIVKETYFGAEYDRKSGMTLNAGFSDLAPTRRETYQYLFDHDLDDKESIVAHASDLLAQYADNPKVQALILSDPYVNKAFVTPAGEQFSPLTREYIIAIDHLLRAINNEDVVDPQNVISGYMTTLSDKYFTVGSNTNPQVVVINSRIEALENDPRISSINDQIRLIGLDISDAYKDVSLGISTQAAAEAKVAALEAQRQQLLLDKARISEDNRKQAETLRSEKATLMGRPLPPDGGFYEFLVDTGAANGAEIAEAVKALAESSKDQVSAVYDYINTGVATPELQAWISERTSQLTGLPPDQIERQIYFDLRSVFVLNNPIGTMTFGRQELNTFDSDSTARNWITAGSLIYALSNKPAAADIKSELTTAGNQTPFPSSFGGTGGSSSRQGGSSSFTPSQNAPRQTSAPRQTAPQRQTVAVDGVELSFSLKTWQDFRTATRTIFGSTRTVEVLEKIFATGKPLSDPTASRQLRFIWPLFPIEGVTSFNAWLGAMRMLYNGVASYSGSSSNRRFFPTPDVRTRRPL